MTQLTAKELFLLLGLLGMFTDDLTGVGAKSKELQELSMKLLKMIGEIK